MLSLLIHMCFMHVVCSMVVQQRSLLAPRLPEEKMNVSQMVEYHGYPCNIHHVQTEDGYILTLHHIPHGRSSKSTERRQPVFLQHGIIDSAATFTMNLPNQSLAFVLADAGYDVWLGNSRGNTYSRKHVKYTIEDKEFWDFSFDEMAKYDLPASIDYVINETKYPDLYYVGHSQGTSIGWIAFGQNKTLASKVKTFFALAPVATVSHIEGGLRLISKISPELEIFFKIFGIKEFLPSNIFIKFLAQDVCGLVSISEKICGCFIFLIAGYDLSNLNETRLPIYMSHLPAGTSTKDVIHFAQMIRSGKFQMFDYGERGNMVHYKVPIAPSYNVSLMDVPTALFTGTHDWLADPTDVNDYLVPRLPNVVFHKNVQSWNHLDFVWGVDANRVIYDDIVKLMNRGGR